MQTKNRMFQPFLASDDDKTPSSDIYIKGITDELATCPFRKQVHRHTFFEIIWLARGRVSFFCDFQNYALDAGALALISPGQVHTMNPKQSDTQLIIIGFTSDLFSLYGRGSQFLEELPFNDNKAYPYIDIKEEQLPVFENLFTMARERYLEGGPKSDELLLAYLNVVLIEALQIYETSPKHSGMDAPKSLTQNFRIAIEQHYLKRRQVKVYADMLGVTANHLVETVRQTTGMTPGRILSDRLMLEAKRLLVHTQQSLSEIAYHLAFSDPSQFGRWFKNTGGLSPGKFRQEFTVP